jgi:hypothetical protein
MEEFAADTTLEVRRKSQLDDEVSSGAPWMEVHMDETLILRQRGTMTSTVESHVHVKRCRGVHVIDYALLDGKSGTEVLQKHPHPTINSRGGREGWVSLGVSIEAGNKLECSIPRDVSYEPGYDVPCVDAQKKSYSDTNVEQWVLTATETQGYPSKVVVDEETSKAFKTECDKKELENCSADQKRIIARDEFKAKNGSYDLWQNQRILILIS